MKMSTELKKLLQPGKKIKIYFNDNNVHNALLHVRAIVDDEYVVVRSWSRRKRCWIYKVDWYYIYELYLEHGYLTSAD